MFSMWHAGLLALALLAPAFAQRNPFVDDLADITPWQTSSPASTISLGSDEAAGIPRLLQWRLPAMEPSVYFTQRPLPIKLDRSHVIALSVRTPCATAIEVQIATPGDARCYQICHLPGPGWHSIRVPIGEMSYFGGFTRDDLAGPTFLRLWVDGNPDWAGGAVPRDRPMTLRLADLSITSELADLPEGIGARITVDPSRKTGRVHPHVYGQFLEHIYHSVEDGLFGELIKNRAFVPPHGFIRRGDTLVQSSMGTDVKLFMGDRGWTDYEMRLKARKTGGAEGLLILLRCADERNFYWWNLGGWGNVRHALESEVDDARHTVDAGVEGTIETGRWYDIRVRAQGDHIQGWLDGDKLLDVRDAAHAVGGVGVGTWATRAEFGDITVSDLSGKPLPLTLPAPTEDERVPDSWVPYPAQCDGAITLVRVADSPNTGWAVRIELPDDERPAGMAQKGLKTVSGHTYSGVAWLRARDEVSSVRVALCTSEGRVMSSQALDPGTEGWTGCKFDLRADAGDAGGSLVLQATGSGALLVDMVSLMRDDSLNTSCRADLLEAVRALGPPIIRWPGGCFASIYRWKRSIGPQNERKPFYNTPWGEWDSAGFGTDEFIRLCREVDAEPLIVLNLGSWDSPEKVDEYLLEALEWIEYCNGDVSTPMGKLRAQSGHPEPFNVTHWELDNETWGMGVEAYAQRVRTFGAAIRQRWPNLTLYACTFWEKEDARLLELAGEYIDLISYHLYENPDNYIAGPKRLQAIWRRYEALIADSKRPDAKLAVTEWNAQSTDWRTGLFAAGLLNVMERLDVVQMASPALFLRRVDAVAWDNAFINHDSTGWFPAPNYVVMKLYREHFQPVRVACEVKGPVDAVATTSEDGGELVLKVINPEPEAVSCALAIGPQFPFQRGRQYVIQADPTDRNSLQQPANIRPVSSEIDSVRGQSMHELPPHSVTVLTFSR